MSDLTAKQRATLSHLNALTWMSSPHLGFELYRADAGRGHDWAPSYAKIANDRLRPLLKKGLVERRWNNYNAFAYRLTEAGRNA